MVQLIAQRLQEQYIVCAVRRRITETVLIEPAAAGIFPVHVDAIEAVARRDVHRGLREVESLLRASRDGEERRRKRPAAD